jgi:hypothetical protein
MRRLIAASFLLAAVAISAGPADAGAKRPFNGNVCGIPSATELAAAHIGARCAKLRTQTRPTRPSPPSGTLGQTTYIAEWGRPRLPTPSHWLFVEITEFYGTGRALPEFRRTLHRQVLAQGAPITVGHPGSLLSATSSCTNPPTFECMRGQLLALVGNNLVTVSLLDAPPTTPEAEASPLDDEAQEKEQATAFRAEITAIARSVAARL